MKKSIVSFVFFFLLCLTPFGNATISLPSTTYFPYDGDCVDIVALNNGKADCLIIKAYGQAFMIDTGYAFAATMLTTALEQLGITALDGVFITHNHKDHIGGLSHLLNTNVSIKTVYAPYYSLKDDAGNHPLVTIMKDSSIPLYLLHANDQLSFRDVSFSVLGPTKQAEDTDNNNSLVMTMRTKEGDILLTGDMKFDEEQALLQRNAFTQCDILKVPYHAREGATSLIMLKKVKPQVAIITTHTLFEQGTPNRELLLWFQAMNTVALTTQSQTDALLLRMIGKERLAYNISWDLPKRPEINIKIDIDKEMIFIENISGNTLVMKGYSLFTTKGDKTYALPDFEIEPEKELSIATRKSKANGDITLPTTKTLWHKTAYDTLVLLDGYGRMIDIANND